MTPETTLISIITPTFIDTSYNCSCRWYKALFSTVSIAFKTDKWMPVGYFISWISFREVSLSKTGSSAVTCIAGVNRKNNLPDHIFSWWKLWGPPGLWRYIPAKIQLSHSMSVCILICAIRNSALEFHNATLKFHNVTWLALIPHNAASFVHTSFFLHLFESKSGIRHACGSFYASFTLCRPIFMNSYLG